MYKAWLPSSSTSDLVERAINISGCVLADIPLLSVQTLTILDKPGWEQSYYSYCRLHY